MLPLGDDEADGPRSPLDTLSSARGGWLRPRQVKQGCSVFDFDGPIQILRQGPCVAEELLFRLCRRHDADNGTVNADNRPAGTTGLNRHGDEMSVSGVWRSARSSVGDRSARVAETSSRPSHRTPIVRASFTTCHAVKIRPSGRTRNPVPCVIGASALARALNCGPTDPQPVDPTTRKTKIPIRNIAARCAPRAPNTTPCPPWTTTLMPEPPHLGDPFCHSDGGRGRVDSCGYI